MQRAASGSCERRGHGLSLGLQKGTRPCNTLILAPRDPYQILTCRAVRYQVSAVLSPETCGGVPRGPQATDTTTLQDPTGLHSREPLLLCPSGRDNSPRLGTVRTTSRSETRLPAAADLRSGIPPEGPSVPTFGE